jgi:hypothetical protein
MFNPISDIMLSLISFITIYRTERLPMRNKKAHLRLPLFDKSTYVV